MARWPKYKADLERKHKTLRASFWRQWKTLVGQALWAAIVLTWFFSRAFGDRPAQGFRGRPRLARVVADMMNFGAASAASQGDLGAIAPYNKLTATSLAPLITATVLSADAELSVSDTVLTL